MTKKILYLTFYFEPDLCAGSFRNSPLAYCLAKKLNGKAEIDVITTLPNRYSTFSVEAPSTEKKGNMNIFRIAIPQHKSGMKDQILSFKKYFTHVKKIVSEKKYDLVIASSSRLFTAYLGYSIAKKQGIPLFLDIRDIFYDTLEDVLPNGIQKKMVLPIIKLIEKKTFSYASHINLISKGFKDYFKRYKKPNYSFFPNGIDEIFIENYDKQNEQINEIPEKFPKTIVYAGNIGEGQGLHKIVPKIARELGDTYEIIIIGDGGAKQKLIDELESIGAKNVVFLPPVKRDELIELYNNSDYLFVHLNDYKAFEKVLPSKLFELSTFSKPIIAGVGGYAATFVKESIENSILFKPCNLDDFILNFGKYEYMKVKRKDFVNSFRRDIINDKLSETMIKYL